MNTLDDYIRQITEGNPTKIVISKPASKSMEYKRITIEGKADYYQIARYTEKQVFHENISFLQLCDKCIEIMKDNYLQLNAWSADKEFSIMISKKGKVFFKAKNNVSKTNCDCHANDTLSHNRKKNYILEEGQIIEPLVDMGIFTKEGKIVNSMYDKYKQINRFIEIIDDAVKQHNYKKLNIIDFGCGKSYLTFIVYYYFTVIKEIEVNMIGLDLKADVIKKCNEAAKKYGYSRLRFELGDINGYDCPFDVDMVITLHACDTATDYALYNAISWNAKMIFSVPCCQHELNKQIKTDTFSLLTDYGIIGERFSALMTDAIRGKLLEYSGYKTQLLEFIDFAHTPKNILIRAIRNPQMSVKAKNSSLTQVERAMDEFNVKPTLYELIMKKED